MTLCANSGGGFTLWPVLQCLVGFSINNLAGLIAKLFPNNAMNDDLVDRQFNRGYNPVYRISSKEASWQPTVDPFA